MEKEERKEKILGVITEFGGKLAVQPEVVEAIHDESQPLWERLSVADLILAFELAVRDKLPQLEDAKGK